MMQESSSGSLAERCGSSAPLSLTLPVPCLAPTLADINHNNVQVCQLMLGNY